MPDWVQVSQFSSGSMNYLYERGILWARSIGLIYRVKYGQGGIQRWEFKIVAIFRKNLEMENGYFPVVVKLPVIWLIIPPRPWTRHPIWPAIWPPKLNPTMCTLPHVVFPLSTRNLRSKVACSLAICMLFTAAM